MREYHIADLFCGAGGFSTGAARAIAELDGAMRLVAVNHWPTAVETHAANHPEGRHIIADLSAADPYDLAPARRLDLLLASPECRYYSRSNGGRTTQDQGRMNPWVIHDWITKLDVPVVIVENVREFLNWGPLDRDGQRDKTRAGQYFQAWFLTFGNLGYQAEWRLLNAADYGDATSRTRLFVMARKDGRPPEWPEPTHGDPNATGAMMPRQPWRTAADIIDWQNVGVSIFGRQRPLSRKTIARIAWGVKRYNPLLAPLLLPMLTGETARPMYRGMGPPRGEGYYEERAPFIVQYYGQSTCHPVDIPLSTVPTVKHHGLALPSDGDIHYRMLNNGELARAMGFSDAEREYRFAGSDPEITRQIGNAVPVGLATALVRAALS